MNISLNFDATKFNPEQGIPKHPTGKFPAIVSEVGTEENKNKDGGYFSVTFTTQAGQIRKNYNLWFQNPDDGKKQAIEIASKQLSALCHATGVFRLGDGRELINARCTIEVTPQARDDKYNEVSKVYDANGNEPGKATPAPAVQQGGQQGGWPQQQAPSAPPPANNAPPPAAAPANAAPSWSPGPSAAPGTPPPWASGGR